MLRLFSCGSFKTNLHFSLEVWSVIFCIKAVIQFFSLFFFFFFSFFWRETSHPVWRYLKSWKKKRYQQKISHAFISMITSQNEYSPSLMRRCTVTDYCVLIWSIIDRNTISREVAHNKVYTQVQIYSFDFSVQQQTRNIYANLWKQIYKLLITTHWNWNKMK